jgi:hypothetical protein
MKLLLTGLFFLASSVVYAMIFGEDDFFFIMFFLSWALLAIGIPRFIWLKAKTISRVAGKIAAQGANHVDTFKDAFKDERNK